MYCDACGHLLTSPIFENCPECGYPTQVELERRVESYVEILLTSPIWRALHASSRRAVLQAEREYHTVWLTKAGEYDLEIIKRLYSTAVALQFEHSLIQPFISEHENDLQGAALDRELGQQQSLLVGEVHPQKYPRKGLQSEHTAGLSFVNVLGWKACSPRKFSGLQAAGFHSFFRSFPGPQPDLAANQKGGRM